MFSSNNNVNNFRTGKVVKINKSGRLNVRSDKVDFSTINATQIPLRIGDSVLLSKIDGKDYIIGKTNSMGNTNIKEIYRNG